MDQIPTILKRFRQSVLTAAVTGKLTEKWRDEHPDTECVENLFKRILEQRELQYLKIRKTSKHKNNVTTIKNNEPLVREDFDLFKLPESWRWSDLAFLMDKNETFCYGVVQPGLEDRTGNFLIRAGDLKNIELKMNSLRTISKEVDEKYKRSRIKGGEILMTVVGAGVGTTTIAPKSCEGYNIARAVAKIPIREFNSSYILLWLSTSIANAWLFGEAREVARPTLNLEQLATIVVPVPPLEEQKEIAIQVNKLFSLADKLEAHYQHAKAQVDKLSQSVLAKAFRGELVPQDPNDEPSEKLLERIMEEKTKMEAALKKTRKRAPSKKK